MLSKILSFSSLLFLLAFNSCTEIPKETISVNSDKLLEAKEITIGSTYTLKGKTIPGEWDIQVALPEDYDTTKDNYPVIYILDGKKYFNFALGRLQGNRDYGPKPKSIIVGINRGSFQNHFSIFGSKSADQFLEFIEKEIFPFIASKFRVHHTKTIMGWHYEGSFVLHALEKKPELFDNYIACSPYFPGLRTVKDINFDALNNLNLSTNKLNKQLYFGAMINEEQQLATVVTQLDSILQSAPPKNLTWNYHLAEADYGKHSVSVYRLLGPGMRQIYSDYSTPLRFNDLAEFNNKGGLQFVKNHYKQLAIQYGGTSEIPTITLWGLFTIAKKGKDSALYEELMA